MFHIINNLYLNGIFFFMLKKYAFGFLKIIDSSFNNLTVTWHIHSLPDDRKQVIKLY